MTLSLRQLFFAFIATSSLLLSGCGPDDKSDGQKPSAPLPTAVGRAPSTAPKGSSRWKNRRSASCPPASPSPARCWLSTPRWSPAAPAEPLVADKQGFFTQWSEVAKQRHVERLYQVEPNAEAVAAAAPDLIVVAATGGDSALKLYDQLSAIAPTLVLDMATKLATAGQRARQDHRP